IRVVAIDQLCLSFVNILPMPRPIRRKIGAVATSSYSSSEYIARLLGNTSTRLWSAYTLPSFFGMPSKEWRYETSPCLADMNTTRSLSFTKLRKVAKSSHSLCWAYNTRVLFLFRSTYEDMACLVRTSQTKRI